MYDKLKPEPPTPLDEICTCDREHPIALCYALTNNPIRCIECYRELPPERLQPPPEMVEIIAKWRRFYSCFYLLWLDSGEFEDWARQQLLDPKSAANRRSYETCKIVSQLRRCYHWWFQEPEIDGYEPLSYCPKCQAKLTEKFDRLVCENCQILIP
jgi:hypothetical protein